MCHTGKYLEIFARKNNLRNYWVSIGNEVTGTGLPEGDMQVCLWFRGAGGGGAGDKPWFQGHKVVSKVLCDKVWTTILTTAATNASTTAALNFQPPACGTAMCVLLAQPWA